MFPPGEIDLLAQSSSNKRELVTRSTFGYQLSRFQRYRSGPLDAHFEEFWQRFGTGKMERKLSPWNLLREA